MPETSHVPIIFLAFAKRDDSLDRDDLRNLPDEIHGITDALKAAEKEGLCKDPLLLTISHKYDTLKIKKFTNGNVKSFMKENEKKLALKD